MAQDTEWHYLKESHQEEIGPAQCVQTVPAQYPTKKMTDLLFPTEFYMYHKPLAEEV